jgi:Adenylate and Guanylate cyclase catalytic domain
MVATLSGWVNLTFRTFEQRQVPKLETAIVQTSLQVRVGIATGLVVVGDLIGSGEAQERGIVGETPNLAARLQAIAEPNMVVIAEGTQRLLGNLFELRDLGAKDLKGIAGSPGRIGKILDLVFSAFNMGPPFDPPFGFFAEEPVDRTRMGCCCRRVHRWFIVTSKCNHRRRRGRAGR